MPDDWEWFWAGEGGRDSLLRTEIEGLHSQASAARSQAARLSSQLAKVQGSMETRLSALAAAFDAYVELGDVREQLAGYPDTWAVRREATAAFEVLTRGGIPERLLHPSVDYWLSDAMNAVIARAAGRPDEAAEARAVALDRDAELFLVTAAGAVGHGAQVAERLPSLMVTDGELTTAQRALWTAVLAGEYGEALPTLRDPWQPALGGSDADWPDWVRREARANSPVEILRWIERHVAAAQPGADAQTMAPSPAAARPTTPVPADDLVLAEPVSGATEADPRTTARTDLASVALALVGRGLGDEVGLLERARELRARIESPDHQSVHRSKRADPTATPPTTAVGEVRAAFLAAPPGSPLRTELLRWIQPGLLGTVALVVAEAVRSVPEPVEVRTPGGVVEVSAAGAPPEVRQRAEARVQERHAPPPRSTLVAPAVVGAVLLVATVVIAVVGPNGLAWLTGLGTVVTAGVVLRALTYERRRRQELDLDLAATRESLDKAETRAQQLESARLRTVEETQQLAVALRDRLAVPVG